MAADLRGGGILPNLLMQVRKSLRIAQNIHQLFTSSRHCTFCPLAVYRRVVTCICTIASLGTRILCVFFPLFVWVGEEMVGS
jgi:hypothetical protein